MEEWLNKIKESLEGDGNPTATDVVKFLQKQMAELKAYKTLGTVEELQELQAKEKRKKMKIEINKKKNMVSFEKIRCGEVFLLSGSYLMKIAPIIAAEYEPVAARLMINPDSPIATTAVREGSEGVIN